MINILQCLSQVYPERNGLSSNASATPVGMRNESTRKAGKDSGRKPDVSLVCFIHMVTVCFCVRVRERGRERSWRVLCYIEKVIEFPHTCWHWSDLLMIWKLVMMNCSFNALPEFSWYHLKMFASLFINEICLWFSFPELYLLYYVKNMITHKINKRNSLVENR